MQLLTGRALLRHAGALALGVVVGVVGTGVHRWSVPWGLVVALVMVVVVGVLVRAWIGATGVFATGLGIMGTVGVLGAGGPGGDVLVAAQPVGLTWYGGALAIALAYVLPARWFSDAPLVPRTDGQDPGGT